MNLKDLRSRKSSIVSTRKLTAAMKMVSGAKFGRAYGVWEKSRQPLRALHEWAGRLITLCEQEGLDPSPLVTPSPPEDEQGELPSLLVVMTSDKGLCGGFNQNVLRKARQFLTHEQKRGVPAKVVCVGQKGYILLRKSHEVVGAMDLHHALHFENIAHLFHHFFPLFQKGHVRRCYVLYSRFHNVLRQEPVVVDLCPLTVVPVPEGGLVNNGLLTCSPSLKVAREQTLLLLITNHLFSLLCEHVVSEHGARMTAMDGATKNADEIIRELNLAYNHLRQEMITKELIEIISGAEAAV